MASKWDIRFLQLAKHVSTWSKDPSTQAGAVIVRPDRSVCSTGFNGFAKNMQDNPEFYADREVKYSRIIHCEINAQIFARDPDLSGYTLYTWPFACCDRCCVQMLQAGIIRFVFPKLPGYLEERWLGPLELTKKYIAEAGLEAVEIPQSEIPQLIY